jgi:hypothetical protein
LRRVDRDKRLIEAALDRLDELGLSDLKAEGGKVGVSHETIRRWRNGDLRGGLNKNTRPLVEAFLATNPPTVKPVTTRENSRLDDRLLEQKAAAWDSVAALVRALGVGLDEEGAPDRFPPDHGEPDKVLPTGGPMLTGYSPEIPAEDAKPAAGKRRGRRAG